MTAGETPLALRVRLVRWRRTLESYCIDGTPVFNLSRSQDRTVLDGMVSRQTDVTTGTKLTPIEPRSSILAHTAGKQPIIDDNMGTEWRYPLGLE